MDRWIDGWKPTSQSNDVTSTQPCIPRPGGGLAVGTWIRRPLSSAGDPGVLDQITNSSQIPEEVYLLIRTPAGSHRRPYHWTLVASGLSGSQLERQKCIYIYIYIYIFVVVVVVVVDVVVYIYIYVSMYVDCFRCDFGPHLDRFLMDFARFCNPTCFILASISLPFCMHFCLSSWLPDNTLATRVQW